MPQKCNSPCLARTAQWIGDKRIETHHVKDGDRQRMLELMQTHDVTVEEPVRGTKSIGEGIGNLFMVLLKNTALFSVIGI